MRNTKTKRRASPVILAALVALSTFLGGSVIFSDRPDPAAKLRRVTTHVLAYAGTNFAGSGTGVYLRGKDGNLYVLTAAHVMPDECDARMVVEHHFDWTRVLPPCVETELILIDRERDVCLLRLVYELDWMEPAKMAAKAAGPQDVVQHVGFFHSHQVPLGYTRGVMMNTNCYKFLPPVTIMLDAVNLMAMRGCSGGGLFNEAGELVGTMTGSTETGLALTVPLWRILEALRVGHCPVEFD